MYQIWNTFKMILRLQSMQMTHAHYESGLFEYGQTANTPISTNFNPMTEELVVGLVSLPWICALLQNTKEIEV